MRTAPRDEPGAITHVHLAAARDATPEPGRATTHSGHSSTQRRYRTSDGQTIIGYTSTVIGAFSLGAVLLGFLRGSEIVPMFLIGSVGLVVATVWCGLDKKFQTATVFGALAGFNLSYALLQIGVSNNWYSIPIQDLTNVLSFYSVAWITIFVLLSYVAYTASPGAFLLFGCFDLSLALVVWANASGSLDLLRWAALPLAITIVISSAFIGHVMWGWNRRSNIEATRLREVGVERSDRAVSTARIPHRRRAVHANGA